jgi:hypothetical protein
MKKYLIKELTIAEEERIIGGKPHHIYYKGKIILVPLTDNAPQDYLRYLE